MERQAINKIVGIKDGEVFVLEEVFNEGFSGAVGYSMRPLTKDYAEEMKDPEYIRDLWKQAVQAGDTDMGLQEWAEEVNKEAEMEGRLFATDDPSYRDEFEDLVEELPQEQKEQVQKLTDLTWEVSSGGRCFEKDMKFDVLFDKELLDLINKYEK